MGKKIIKHGKKEESIVKRFRCLSCDCYFECGKDDYKEYEHCCHISFYSDCPECGGFSDEVLIRPARK